MSPSTLPLKTTQFKVNISSLHSIFLQILILASIFLSSAATSTRIPYGEHCNSVLTEPTPTGFPAKNIDIYLYSGYIAKGGENFFGPRISSNQLYFQLYNQHVLETSSPDVFQINAYFHIRNTDTRNISSFDLSGFWSAKTGKLCMVGRSSFRRTFRRDNSLSVVLKLNYANTTSISTAIVNGTLESLDAGDSQNYFDSISLIGYSYDRNYEYTLIQKASESCSRRLDSLEVTEKPISFRNSACMYIQQYLTRAKLQLEQNFGCSSSKCGPFGTSLGFSPQFMSLTMIQCSEDLKFNLKIKLYNDSTSMSSRPDMLLIGEGSWHKETNRLCIIACPVHIDKSTGIYSTGDCDIGFSLWFSSVMTLHNRSIIDGRIWSNKDAKDNEYFTITKFKSYRERSDFILPGLKYKYTELDTVKKHCDTNEAPKKQESKRFPDGYSMSNLQFDFKVKNGVNPSWGYATVVSLGESINQREISSAVSTLEPYSGNVVFAAGYEALAPAVYTTEIANKEPVQQEWNVSYKMVYDRNSSNASTELNVEGIYNSETGRLCMTGCRYFGKQSADCQIVVNIQFASLRPELGEHLTGTIRSTRDKKDQLYFDDLQVSSNNIYVEQAVESIQRMDIEIIMVLVSLTFSCVCIAVQLFHVKKNPEVLPSISIFMLVILTLGYMIPLLLNFEALFFRNPDKHNVLLSSGGWVEVNEVIVRLITMIAFLLQFRLLQCVWSAKTKEQQYENLWIAEKETLMMCLPLYLAGGFLTWFVNLKPSSTKLAGIEFGTVQHSFLQDSITYAGLVRDGFLLPQIILNVFMNSNNNKVVLKSVFYIGTTIVRATPHLYDVYRARRYIPFLNSSYIYASPDDDFYSLAWDIIIPCCGILFAVLIFLQQRYGGTKILPAKLRKIGQYVAVPTVNS